MAVNAAVYPACTPPYDDAPPGHPHLIHDARRGCEDHMLRGQLGGRAGEGRVITPQTYRVDQPQVRHVQSRVAM